MKTSMRKTGNFIRKNQRLLAVSLLMASIVSCKKGVVEPTVENTEDLNASVSTRALGSNLIWSDDAESSSLFSTYVSKHTATSYAITAASNPVYQGVKSARFELRDSDPEVKNGTRTEISFPDDATNLNRWYSYALYAPSDKFKYDDDDDVISQWHQGGGKTPALCLRVRKDRIFLRILGTWVDIGAFEKDVWRAYVIHVKHSSGSDGLIEIWRDGVKIMNRSGANMYAVTGDIHNPKLKMGIYKSNWNGSGTTMTNIRVLYFDDIRLGNENATYEDMVPTKNGSTPTEPTEPTSPDDGTSSQPPVTEPTSPTTSNSVIDFKLVNSHTEKDVVSITNGATISLSALNIEKANIRAVVSDGASSVKFELSGKQSKSYTDSDAPYALHGDNGDGNFYYGNWNPPALGTYTLKATPYSANKATGTMGTAKTITFTIVK